MMKILASEQVSAWVSALPPQTKHRVRMALRRLAMAKGDVKQLAGPLEGFCRLRIGGMRIVFHYVSAREIRLEYANTRDVVYELFQSLLEDRGNRP